MRRALLNAAMAIQEEGTAVKGQLEELKGLDDQARAVFEQFKADDLKKWADEIAELEKERQAEPDVSEQMEALRTEIQNLASDIEYGNLSQAEYDRMGACREEIKECEARKAALQSMTGQKPDDFDKKIEAVQDKITELKKLITDVALYMSKRAELTFSQLKMNKVEISLYDVVKTTGEVKDTFKFTYGGRRYDRLSLSEKVRAGMELSELMKRLTGRNYPVFVDNMESVDDLNNVRPSGQLIMAKCVRGAALSVRPMGSSAGQVTDRAAEPKAA